ncbi:DUF4333 domain-containing protein [Blastococcus sp. PRF04-17]|uniref:DUF4333 domain-containing protein n=1 Tax=Blastococcus sp. PRF04-17 TaxID=2933797 RepID=UPI001FF41E15|nr:DUF4333 domain-containing protein [Blastococcus sp. PRF04-17]UOY02516.1 DUF4333 domain-containing protein [Blastococcus sp. PRF04-17]
MDRALSRTRILAGAGVALVSLAAALAVVAWLLRQPQDLDAAEVERDVAAQFQAEHGVAVDLDCPDEMPTGSGEVHPCDGVTPDGDEVYVEIQIADPEEEFDYRWWTSFPR